MSEETEKPELDAPVPTEPEEAPGNGEAGEGENGSVAAERYRGSNDYFRMMMDRNFLEYASYVIKDRAIPDVDDGLKPVQRRVLWALYQVYDGRTHKVANIVGNTMHFHPHGNASIEDALVVLANKEYYITRQGNFGNILTGSPAAAGRYIECSLSPLGHEVLFNNDITEFVDTYDGRGIEPVVLPAKVPSLLMLGSDGIAVGMASQLCGFNLGEVCDTTIAFLKNPEVRISETLLAPDFPTGGEVLYDPRAIEDIYNTGRGGVKVRARWRYDKKENLIEIYEIPYTTTTEAIMDKVAELIKAGKVKEISDMRDETDLSGLKLTIDLKRGADPDKLMQKLFKATTLQDTASCNFNVLIGGMPRVMGVRELLDEWCAWRTESVKRRVYFVLKKRQDKLHLLKGLKKILLDIDKAIKIIRETEKEADVVPNLMIGFGIDQIQAEYVAEIKLRNINREYILKRVEETASLEAEIEDLEDTLARPSRIRKIIVSELEDVRKKYAEPRRTGILYDYAEDAESEEDAIEDYPVTLFLSQHGYFKKITPQSLRMSGEQKFKEDDALSMSVESSNAAELMFFTDKAQVYKTRASDFADGKASQLGDYLPAKLGMDEGESVMGMVLPGDYSGYMIFFFENGKAAKVELSAYKTTSNRRRLTGAYSDKSPLKALLHLKEDREIAVYSTEPRVLIVNTALLGVKTTRTTQGVALLTLKKKYVLDMVRFPEETGITDLARYRGRSIPVTGALLKTEDSDDKQLSLI